MLTLACQASCKPPAPPTAPVDPRIHAFVHDPLKSELALFWKDRNGKRFATLGTLVDTLHAENRRLVFAMNGGMFDPDHQPVGLYVEDGQTLAPLNLGAGTGNFYLKPNGVFYVNDKRQAFICPAEEFSVAKPVKYATQSGPLLVIDGKLHPEFKAGSPNTLVRNGVGILPDGRVVFAMSKSAINFHDFGSYFLSLGCRDALYLDGVVSTMFCPELGVTPTDGDLGVLIGVFEDSK